jgi:hypothetical protein
LLVEFHQQSWGKWTVFRFLPPCVESLDIVCNFLNVRICNVTVLSSLSDHELIEFGTDSFDPAGSKRFPAHEWPDQEARVGNHPSRTVEVAKCKGSSFGRDGDVWVHLDLRRERIGDKRPSMLAGSGRNLNHGS